MPSKIPPCNYQRKTICGYHRRAVAAVKFSPGGTLLGSACEFFSSSATTTSSFFLKMRKRGVRGGAFFLREAFVNRTLVCLLHASISFAFAVCCSERPGVEVIITRGLHRRENPNPPCRNPCRSMLRAEAPPLPVVVQSFWSGFGGSGWSGPSFFLIYLRLALLSALLRAEKRTQLARIASLFNTRGISFLVVLIFNPDLQTPDLRSPTLHVPVLRAFNPRPLVLTPRVQRIFQILYLVGRNMSPSTMTMAI